MAVLALLVGVLLGPQCADGMAMADPVGGHGIAAPLPLPVAGSAVDAEAPMDGPMDLGGVLALCVTFVVAVLLMVVGRRPVSVSVATGRSPAFAGVRPSIAARAPTLERLCVLRT